MIHDEKTTEIELPAHLVQKTKPLAKINESVKTTTPEFIVKDRRSQFMLDFQVPKTQSKLSQPWLIRLLSLISILVLSLLVF